MDVEHVDVVAVEAAEHLGADDLVGRPARGPARRRGRRPGPSPAAAGSSRAPRAAPRSAARGDPGQQRDDLLLAAQMSRFASGSSSSSSSGRLIRACAIRTRCCSPPDSSPTRASANRCASTALSISLDQLAAGAGTAARSRSRARRGRGRPGPGPASACPGPPDLLRHVSDRRVACRARGRRRCSTGPGGRCSPRITRSRVVLPAPFEPIRPVNSPAATVKRDVSRICRPPQRDARPRRSLRRRSPRGPSSQLLGGGLAGTAFCRWPHLGQHPGLEVVARAPASSRRPRPPACHSPARPA